MKASFEACVAQFGRIDILVNNVGGSAPGGPVEMSEEVFDSQIAHNLKTAFLGCKYVLPIMEKQGKGAIVNLASVAGLRDHLGRTHVGYSASKAGVIQLSRATAVKYAPLGIRVNTVVPGLMNTPPVTHRLARQSGNNRGDTAMSEERFVWLTEETMTPEQKRVAEGIASGPRGSWQRGPFKALLRSPEAADRIQKVGEFVRFKSSIEPRLNELAICICGRKWTAQYEWYAHRKLALEAGLKAEILDAVAEGRRPANMQEDETAVYDFACQLVHTGQVDDAAYAAAKAKFGEQGIIDLIAAVGYYTIVSFVLNVDRVPLPPDAVPLKPL